MAFTIARDEAPLGEMNTTPLIDVMLVLLIMFVITIPIATHTVPVALPPIETDRIDPPLSPVMNKIVVDAEDRMLWNGTPIEDAQLPGLLASTLALPVEPELQFEPSERASYDRSARIVAAIQRAGVTRFGFVGNERYREFADGPAGVDPTVTVR